jgi:nickel/cobalt exporter
MISSKMFKQAMKPVINILVFITVSIIALDVLWQEWPSLVMTSINMQRDIYAELSDLLYEAKADNVASGLMLIGLSFLYGMFHSLGPGHGKMIVTTYLVTHPTKVNTSLLLTLLSSMVQALVAVTLVSVLLVLFKASMHEVNAQADQFIRVSFYIVLILGGLIVIRSLKQLWRSLNNQKEGGFKIKGAVRIRSSSLLNNENINNTAVSSCSCGHKHFATADEMNRASSMREYVGIIISIGMRPCTGAIMVLLFANMINIYWLGVISAFVMAIGTALTTSTIAVMTITGKKVVQRYLKVASESAPRVTRIHSLLQLSGGIVLMIFGLLLLNSQVLGMSPIFKV